MDILKRIVVLILTSVERRMAQRFQAMEPPPVLMERLRMLTAGEEKKESKFEKLGRGCELCYANIYSL
jgi:hypothetical protein